MTSRGDTKVRRIILAALSPPVYSRVPCCSQPNCAGHRYPASNVFRPACRRPIPPTASHAWPRLRHVSHSAESNNAQTVSPRTDPPTSIIALCENIKLNRMTNARLSDCAPPVALEPRSNRCRVSVRPACSPLPVSRSAPWLH